MAHTKTLVVGFSDMSGLARRVATLLGCPCALVTSSAYPGGEMCLRGVVPSAQRVIVVSDVSEYSDSLLRVLSVAWTLRDRGIKHVTLLSPWIAYGRQDRSDASGALAIGVAIGHTLSDAFDRIITLDAHSSAFIDSFRGKLVSRLPMFFPVKGLCDLVASPDLGAAHRVKHAAQILYLPFLVLEKKRHARKVITAFARESAGALRLGDRVMLVDDIGDSGATLVAAADVLRGAGASSVQAVVSHAIDLAALRKATSGHLASVQALYDHASRRLSPEVLTALVRDLRT